MTEAAQQAKDCWINVRVDEDTHKKISQVAQDETRSISSQVAHFIKQGLAAREVEKQQA